MEGQRVELPAEIAKTAICDYLKSRHELGWVWMIFRIGLRSGERRGARREEFVDSMDRENKAFTGLILAFP
jgi:hypothetical protein